MQDQTHEVKKVEEEEHGKFKTVTLNREQRRELEGKVGKDVAVLSHMMAERAGILSPYQIMAAYTDVSPELKKRKIDDMRKWIKDFDDGLIIRDDEVEKN